MFLVFIFHILYRLYKLPQELKVLRCRACSLEKINAQVYNLLQHLEELDLGDNQVNKVFFIYKNLNFLINKCNNLNYVCS